MRPSAFLSVVILSPGGAKDLNWAASLRAEMLRCAQHDRRGGDLEFARLLLAREKS